jgi:hypothetical protein
MCSCDSGRSYFECHRPHDLLEDQDLAKRQFLEFAGGELTARRVPKAVQRFAKSRFQDVPALMHVLS